MDDTSTSGTARYQFKHEVLLLSPSALIPSFHAGSSWYGCGWRLGNWETYLLTAPGFGHRCWTLVSDVTRLQKCWHHL